MKKRQMMVGIGAVALLIMTSITTWAENNRRVVNAQLTGYQEVAAVSSTGKGVFRARLDEASIEFQLTYSGLEGSVRQAHIHLGQRGVNGGITIWLCQTTANPAPTPAGGAVIPECPQEGTVTGIRMANDVIGPSGQGIAAGEFTEVLRAIRSGNVYANVHTDKHLGGEIRGQIRTDDNQNPH